MGRGALIVPINAGANPYGFLARFQAAPVPGQGWGSASRITRAVAVAVFKGQSEMAVNLTGAMTDVIARAFELSDSFDQSRAFFGLVEMVPRNFWNEGHFDRMTKATQENGQLRECVVSGGEGLPDALKALIERIRAERTG
jgi:hypothetical protein